MALIKLHVLTLAVLLQTLILVVVELPSTESRKKIRFSKGRGEDISFDLQDVQDEDWTQTNQETSNQFMDFLFNSVASMVVVEQIQPMAVPDSRRKFSKKFLGIHVTGEIKLFNGSITDGLETLHRSGDATIATSKNATHGSLLFRFGFALRNVHFRSRFGVKFLKHGPEGDVYAVCPRARLSGTFIVNFPRPPDDPAAMAAMQAAMASQPLSQTINADIEVVRIKVTDLESPTLKMHSANLGPFLKIASSAVVKIFKRSILKKVEHAMEKHMSAVLLRILASPIMKPAVQMAMQLIM